MISLFTVDPGVETGWCWCLVPNVRDPKDEMPEALDKGWLHTGQMLGDENLQAMRLSSLCRRSAAFARRASHEPITTWMVCESFQLRERTSDPSLLSPVRIQSKLELLLHMKRIRVDDYTTQQPSQKSVITDERLRRWGLWLPGKPHACDAMRHAAIRLRS